MSKPTRIRRRQFLVGTGVALAQTAITGRTTPAASLSPAAPPVQTIAPPLSRASGVASKIGVAPGYIISGRGENESNPYFHPLGAPSHERRPIPPPRRGKGVNEDDQGENQQ